MNRTSLLRNGWLRAAIALAGALLVLALFATRLDGPGISYAGLFGLVSAGPYALLLRRNASESGTLVGKRNPATVNAAQSARNIVSTLGGWVAEPEDLGSLGEIWRKLPAVLAGGTLQRVTESPRPTDGSGDRRVPWPNLVPPALLATLYVALLFFSSLPVLYDCIGDRLLVRVCVPLRVCLISGLDWWVTRASADLPLRLALASAGLSLLLLSSAGGAVVRAVKAAEGGTGGFQRRSWYESPMVAALKQEFPQEEVGLYSNSPDALYFFFGVSAHLPPRRPSPSVVPPTDLLQPLAGQWPPEGEALLFWLDKQERAYLYNPDELAGIVTLQVVAEYEDGALCSIQRTSP